jgi:hypothetical protein
MRVRGILLIGAGALLLATGSADAAKLRVRSTTAVVSGGAPGRAVPVSAVAHCPKRTKAVAGGYETSSPQSLARRVVVQESRMLNGKAWRVTGFESASAPASDMVTSYVYCGKRKRALVVGSPIRTDFLRDAGQSTTSAAQCPPHTTAFSGGFSATGDVYFFRSRRAGRFWEVGVTNVSGPSGAPYITESYCGRGKVITRSATQPVASADGTLTATPAHCPKGTAPRSGGFDGPETFGGLSNAALVFRSRLLGGTWVASAVPGGHTGGPTITAYAYCRA